MKYTFLLFAFATIGFAMALNAEQPLPQPKDTVIYYNDSTKADTLKYSPVINTPRSNVRGN